MNRQPNLNWECWEDSHDRTWARSFRAPLGIVTTPAGSQNYRIHYGEQYLDDEIPPTQAQAREAFLSGYAEAGGDPVQLATYFQASLLNDQP